MSHFGSVSVITVQVTLGDDCESYSLGGRWEGGADGGGEAQDGAQGTEAVHSVHGFGHFSQHGYFLVYFTS